jgi:hypothetical protein
MMVNIECQSSSFLFDDPSRYLPKMSSTTNLYDYLTNSLSFKMFLNNIDDNDNDDLLLETSPTIMTSSDSSDSAIVSDEIDDFDLTREKPDLTTFTSLSQSFDILNQLEQQTIYEKPSITNQEKYKRPLPWLNSPSSNPPSVELPSNKVVLNYLVIKKKIFF